MNGTEDAVNGAAFVVFNGVVEDGSKETVAIALCEGFGFSRVSEDSGDGAGEELELGHGSWGVSLQLLVSRFCEISSVIGSHPSL